MSYLTSQLVLQLVVQRELLFCFANLVIQLEVFYNLVKTMLLQLGLPLTIPAKISSTRPPWASPHCSSLDISMFPQSSVQNISRKTSVK
ncbi:hypothetical protein F511_20582 [Dorcoceras hygrometricum]|uniref:Uncharacterized protein n=1 Tax=Dorcoceras hygrometricum TaxID=472368 RepID=A0A2Z7DAC8_9LAMI|nr:hypothetical protein F511_20582 [Dorcoceras hygrometricum]